ncbi:MAG TPA: formyltransferase family protein [Syntrophorhabdaceae bacterium]|nr:formyltransferase family protein [Syntrophorhabdaceae bacterium]
MIPREILDIPRVTALNMHGSLLPKYRGRAPVNWVLVNGEKETGVTLHEMVEKPDAGDIIAQKRIEISFEDDIQTLYSKMSTGAGQLMNEILPLLENGTFQGTPQKGPSSYCRGRKPEDGLILWENDAISIYNLTRAVTHPYPGAYTFLDGRKLFVWKTYPYGRNSHEPPGKIVSLRPLIIATGGGLLQLLSLQLENGPELQADEFGQKYDIENKTLGGSA